MKTIQKITLGLCLLLMGDFSFKAAAATTITTKIATDTTAMKFDKTTITDQDKFMTELKKLQDLAGIAFVDMTDIKTLADKLKVFNATGDEMITDAINKFKAFLASVGIKEDFTTKTCEHLRSKVDEAIKTNKIFNVDVSTFIKDEGTLQTALNVLMGYNDMIAASGKKFIVVADKAVADVFDINAKTLKTPEIFDSSKLTDKGVAFFTYLKDKLKTTTAIAKDQDLAATKTVVKEIFTKVQALDIAKGLEDAAPADSGKDSKDNETPEDKPKDLSFMDKVTAGFKFDTEKVGTIGVVATYGSTVGIIGLAGFVIYKATSSDEKVEQNNGEGSESAAAA